MLEIRESQIEDIFATQVDEVKSILSIHEPLTLIDRQRKIDSGRIDLLFLSNTSLHLLELKAVPSRREFCVQTMGYRDDLLNLQSAKQLPSLPLKSYLVCPEFVDAHKRYCLDNDVIPVVFSPYELLKNYYYKVKAISNFVSLKPSNHGLWNLHLFNPIIYSITAPTNIAVLASTVKKSKSTVGSYLRLANELGLLDLEHDIQLSRLGRQYVASRDENMPRLNEKQVDLLKNYITKNPFSSPAVYGIYMAVETVFLLSKNHYPIPLENAHVFFTTISGKQSEWAEKASRDSFTMYSNYAIDLGLLAKIDRDYYITPSGIKFLLLLELNKSILLVDSAA